MTRWTGETVENKLPQRKHPRLKEYDYSAAGAYFVTICTHRRRCILSRVVGRRLAPAETELTALGVIAREQLTALTERFPSVEITDYVIMPNHIHILLTLKEAAGASPRPTVSSVIGAYKSLTTRLAKQVCPLEKLFQTSFHDHVIRSEDDLRAVREYIAHNPARWREDELYSEI